MDDQRDYEEERYNQRVLDTGDGEVEMTRDELEVAADRLASEVHDLANRTGMNPHYVADMVKGYVTLRRNAWSERLSDPGADLLVNEDGSNRDVPPFDNDPRTDAEIKQEVYDRLSDPDYDDDHPDDWEE